MKSTFLFTVVACFACISGKLYGQQQWEQLKDSEYRRIEAVSAVLNDKIYIFSGFTDFIDDELLLTPTAEVFDPELIGSEEGPWRSIEPMPTPVTHSTSIVVGNEIWIPGGFAGNDPGVSIDKIQIYNTETNTWREGPALPEPMASHGAARIDNRIYVFGGLKPDRQTDNEAHYYLELDNQENGWQPAAPLPMARNHFGTTTLQGKIYVIGGQHGHDEKWEDLSYVHAYNPLENKWERLPDLSLERSHFEPGTFAVDGKIIITGGRNQNNNVITDAVSVYDPLEKEWVDEDVLPQRLLAPVARVINDDFFVTHGGDHWSRPFSSAFTKKFSREGNDKLGFLPGSLNATLEQDEKESFQLLLYTLNKETDYQLNFESFPSWVKAKEGDHVNTTGPNSKFIEIELDATGLQPGDYNFDLSAAAPELTTGSLPIKLVVKEGETVTSIPENVEKSFVKVFPNPNDGRFLNIEINNLTPNAQVQINLHDALGKIVLQSSAIPNDKGILNHEWHMHQSLSPGVYIISASNNIDNIQSKLVVQ